MKRKILSLFIVSIMIVTVLTGCGNNEAKDTAKGDEDYEINLGYYN